MRGKYKPFEPDEYDKYDAPAKEAMRVHLTLSGHSVDVPPENFGVDLSSTHQGIHMHHEVEVSNNWKQGDFPFWTGSIPERKIRLVKMCQNEPLYFWRLRLDMKRAIVFSSRWLQDVHLVSVPNWKVPEGELFYRPPKTYGKEFDLLCERY
jgi:hypothetical protein